MRVVIWYTNHMFMHLAAPGQPSQSCYGSGPGPYDDDGDDGDDCNDDATSREPVE